MRWVGCQVGDQVGGLVGGQLEGQVGGGVGGQVGGWEEAEGEGGGTPKGGLNRASEGAFVRQGSLEAVSARYLPPPLLNFGNSLSSGSN